MTTITATVVIEIAGAYAADVAGDLAMDIEAGELDQGIANLVRSHLTNYDDTRDWRVVAGRLWPASTEIRPANMTT